MISLITLSKIIYFKSSLPKIITTKIFSLTFITASLYILFPKYYSIKMSKSIDIEDIDVKSIITKTQIDIDSLIANPYVGCTHACRYCYARFMIRFTSHKGQKWGTFVDVKHWKPLTDKQKQNLKGQNIMISTVTDAYQQIEKKACRTRALLEELKDTGCNIQILTKSSLVLRDIDIFKKFKGKVSIGMSINTLDENFKNEMDYASPIHERINALKELHKQGFYTYIFIAPVFPKITDVIDIIKNTKSFINEIWIDKLNLIETSVRHDINEWLDNSKKYKHLRELYDNPDDYYKTLRKDVKKYCKDNNIKYSRTNEYKFNSKELLICDFMDI